MLLQKCIKVQRDFSTIYLHTYLHKYIVYEIRYLYNVVIFCMHSYWYLGHLMAFFSNFPLALKCVGATHPQWVVLPLPHSRHVVAGVLKHGCCVSFLCGAVVPAAARRGAALSTEKH